MATGNAQALYYLNPNGFGGAVRPNATGWTWDLVVIIREPATNRKECVGGVLVDTLDADTLAQIRDKLAAGVKAEGVTRDFNITVVSYFPLNVMPV